MTTEEMADAMMNSLPPLGSISATEEETRRIIREGLAGAGDTMGAAEDGTRLLVGGETWLGGSTAEWAVSGALRDLRAPWRRR